MEFLLDPNIWIAFAMLTALEIVLGVDNIIFISILVGRLPADVRDKARRLGLGFAMVSRLLLLFSLSWVMSLKTDLFHVFSIGISGRDLVLLFGGLFLLWKASHEIFVEVEAREEDHAPDTDPALIKAYFDMGLMGIQTPERHGGAGGSVGAGRWVSSVWMTLCRACSKLATMMGTSRLCPSSSSRSSSAQLSLASHTTLTWGQARKFSRDQVCWSRG